MIITQYFDSKNYGGLLQAFALQHFIGEEHGTQVSYKLEYKGYWYYIIREIYKVPLSKKRAAVTLFLKELTKAIISPKVCLKIRKRYKIISAFAKSIKHTKKKYDSKSIDNVAGCDDVFITGSDVVWDISCNPYVTALGFVPENKKKISYAASMIDSTIPNGWAEKYLPYVSRLDAISVREKSVAEKLKTMLPDKEISVVVDPTMLFDGSQWSEFVKDRKSPDKYGLIYLLGEDKKQQEEALRFCKDNGIKSLTFPALHGRILLHQKHYGDIQNFTADPFDFVKLIENAEVVITDSFHASVFSVLFHKPLCILKREDASGRLENFADDLGLSHQLYSTDDFSEISKIPDIDYSYSDRIISQKREESIQFLKDNLT